MNKKFRTDIVLALTIPLAGVAAYNHAYQNINNVLLLYLSFITVACEIPFLYENDSKVATDNGIVSGSLVSSVLAISCVFSSALEMSNFIVTFGLMLSGALLRILAKMHLKESFSHSIKVENQHKLVTTGIYSQIRHPSYLGTLLIIAGATQASSIYLCIAMVTCGFIFAEKRVIQEEALLIKHFGEKYQSYILRTKKYIPYLY